MEKSGNTGGKNEEMLKIFKLAAISIIVMNATLMGETIYVILTKEITCREGIVLLLAVALSILEVINNWASISEYIGCYDKARLFVMDILTLGVFYIQVYVLFRIVDSSEGEPGIVARMNFILVTYMALHLCYIIWDQMIRKNGQISKAKRDKIAKVVMWRLAQVVAGGLLALLFHGWLGRRVPPPELRLAWEMLVIGYIIFAGIILFACEKLPKVLQIAMGQNAGCETERK